MMNLISRDNAIYKYFLNVQDVRGMKHVVFLTNFSGAKDPDGLHKKFEFFLEKDEFEKFRKILNEN
jgi:hypothetical protein